MINTLHAKWYDFHSQLLLFFLHKNFQNFIRYHLTIHKWLFKLLERTFNLWLLLVEIETLFPQGGPFSPETGIQKGPASIKLLLEESNLNTIFARTN